VLFKDGNDFVPGGGHQSDPPEVLNDDHRILVTIDQNA